MAEAREGAGFAEEPFHPVGGGDVGTEDFDGDGTVELDVVAQENRPHPAAGNLALDREVRRHGFAEAVEQGVSTGQHLWGICRILRAR